MLQETGNAAAIEALSAATEWVGLPSAPQPVALYRAGAGRPLLCLHAAGHASGDFTPLAQRGGGEFEIVAPDWPGQGRSAPDGGAPRASRYADLALELVETLQLDRPILLGCSIGGAAALTAAHRAPEKFSGLVLCNAGGLAKIDPVARLIIRRMEAMFRAGARGAGWYDRAFRFYYGKMVLPGAPHRAAEIMRAGRSLAPLLAEAWAGFREPTADLRAFPPEIETPVWLAWARGDRFVSWGRAKKAARRFPNRRETLFKGGHAAFLEEPDRFADGLRAFADAL